MKTLPICLLLAAPGWLFCQNESGPLMVKGASPLANPQSELRNPQSTTRAVVVGISDYQDAKIPDLQFAHRDAEAVAAWLQSAAGGGMPKSNIALLTNERATIGQFALALTALMEDCQPGDRALVYFSGHGDVETKTAFQLGFLLCWDSPAQNYMAGGFALYNLQAVVSTLAQKGVKVTVITDACHAGKLAGSSVGGAQITGSNLAKQFANEAKILSCQPNEFSLEGVQWGEGRGVFSYHLIKGLTGLADKNGDGSVSLYEIDRYLGDVVPAQTAPHPQMPFTVGDRQAKLADVDAASLDSLQKTEAGRYPTLLATGSKAAGEALSEADSALFSLFEKSLKTGQLLLPGDSSAWAFYQKSLASEAFLPVRNLMRRNLAAALFDEVQQALNALLESDPYEVTQWRYNPTRYALYPDYLEKALALLGPGHYMEKNLRAKQLYFEAYFLGKRASDEAADTARVNALRAGAKGKLLEALRLEPGAAYINHAIGMLYFWNTPYQTDSLMHYCQKAVELAPKWALPYVDMASECIYSLVDFERAHLILTKCLEANPNSFIAIERCAWTFQGWGKPQLAIPYAQKLIEMRPELTNGHSTLGNIYLQMNEYALAEPLSRKGMELAPEIKWWAYSDYGKILGRTRRFSEAEEHFAKALSDTTISLVEKTRLIQELCYVYTNSHRFEKAEPLARALYEQNQSANWKQGGAVLLGTICFEKGEYAAAKAWMQKAFGLDPTAPYADRLSLTFQALIAEKEGRPDRADSIFRQSKQIACENNDYPYRSESDFFHAHFLLRQNREKAALDLFAELTRRYPKDYRGWYGLALYHADRGEKTAALDNLEKSLELYFPVPGPILEEPLFKKIRKAKRFKALMEKHFPAGGGG